MHQEKYYLRWQTYSDHLKSMMQELMKNEDFADVTLITEDKKHVKANINVLRACSPFFKEMLKKEKFVSPIVYLRGIQFSEMESIMQFIYLGEAIFYEDRMGEILAVAKSLEIKALCDAGAKTPTKIKQDVKLRPNDQVTYSESEYFEDQTAKFELQFFETMEEQALHHNENVTVASKKKKYNCEQCPRTYSAPGALHNHKRSAHQGVRHTCDKCDYQATNQADLTRHIQSMHEGVKYPCDQCDYEATTQSHLTRHIHLKHESANYACGQCDSKFTRESVLRTHIQNKHEGITYACDQCDYRATQKNNLGTHIKNMHEKVIQFRNIKM